MKDIIAFIKDMTGIERLLCVAIIGLFACLPILWLARSYMEAKSYNEVTGSKVTTWQAMWIELRVQSGPGNNDNNQKEK